MENEFLSVLPEELLGMPPNREVEFYIDLKSYRECLQIEKLSSILIWSLALNHIYTFMSHGISQVKGVEGTIIGLFGQGFYHPKYFSIGYSRCYL